jgi:formate hydrogenlyase subunit 3/multisubunit Na+/H+ antiporter MnhD subunit
MDRLGGLARVLPQTTGILALGGLAIVGLPPFSLFISEFAILSEAFSQSRYLVSALFLVTLSIVFGGFLHHFLGIICGEPKHAPAAARLSPSEWIVGGVAVACLLPFRTCSTPCCNKRWRWRDEREHSGRATTVRGRKK